MDVVEVLETNPEFDLALRKYIYKVQKSYNGENGTPVESIHQEKVPFLDNYSLNEWELNHTAEYYHDKLKVSVEKGDLVTYRIRVYNEGSGDDYKGRATQITDYLPEGLVFKQIEAGYIDEWEIDDENTTSTKVVINYKGEKILPVDSLNELVKSNVTNPEQYYQELGIICEVTADVNENDELDRKPLTNRAAITKDEAYEYFNDEDILIEDHNDIDSHPVELSDLGLDDWYTNTVRDEQTPEPYYPGEEDDDDFDTIYVYGYNVKIIKTDGTNKLPGVDLKVLKYRHISSTEEDSNKIELSNLETAVKTAGEGEYNTTAPTLSDENDVYIVKEIGTVAGYSNPFEGKYVEFYMYNNNGEMVTGTWSGSQAAKGFAIYEDNGDEDYFNDKIVDYNSKDENSVYKFATLDAATGAIKLTMVNTKVIPEGYYIVNLKKLGTDGKQLGGVQFEAQAKFNGADNYSSLRDEGEYIVTDAKNTVDVMPKNIPSGVIDIDPTKVDIPDVIVLKEVGIEDGAVNSDGESVNTKYYLGLEGKEIKITINKNQKTEENKLISYVESIKLSVDGEDTKKVSDNKAIDNKASENKANTSKTKAGNNKGKAAKAGVSKGGNGKANFDFTAPEYYTNRELSWILFDHRVLNEARDKSNPLFERLKFLSITASNLDEFFMIRVASLKDMVNAGYEKADISGMTPKQQLAALDTAIHELVNLQYSTYNRSLFPALAQNGLTIVKSHEQLTKEEGKFIDQYFEENVYPVLTPMAVDSSRPFPLIRNKTLNIGAMVRGKDSDDELEFATVQVPSVLSRVVELPERDGVRRVIFLEEIIERNINKLFLNYDIICAHPFRIMRNADLTIEEDEAEDLLKEITSEKEDLVKAGKIKKEKALPEISEDEIPFDIPESWKWIRIGNVASVLGGKRIPAGRQLTQENTGHIYIRVSDMKNDGVDLDRLMYVPNDIYPSISRYIINKEDIYITVAGTIGRVGRIPPELDGANLTENADRIVFFDLDQDWLIFCLSSSVVQKQIDMLTTQVAQPKLAIKKIQEFLIPLPPLNEQERIANKISAVLDLIP